MKVAVVVCMALLSVVLVQAEEEMSPPSLPDDTRITNGRPATPRQFPYMAYILSTDDSGKKSMECGGSLITKLAVLTVAYCVNGRTKFTVRLGSIYRTANDTNAWTVVSTWVVMHPKYNDKNRDNDVAIIYLPREAPLNEFIQPVELPSSSVDSSYVGQRAIISGWGYTLPDSGMSDVLNWANVVVIPNEVCRKAFQNYAFVVTDRNLCAGSFTSTAYFGDKGGPLVIYTRGRYIQIGIYCCFSDYYYNTSFPIMASRVTSFSDWIKLNTESD